jgi:hypothetical protein
MTCIAIYILQSSTSPLRILSESPDIPSHAHAEWAGQQAALPATWALSPGKAATLG